MVAVACAEKIIVETLNTTMIQLLNDVAHRVPSKRVRKYSLGVMSALNGKRTAAPKITKMDFVRMRCTADNWAKGSTVSAMCCAEPRTRASGGVEGLSPDCKGA